LTKNQIRTKQKLRTIKLTIPSIQTTSIMKLGITFRKNGTDSPKIKSNRKTSKVSPDAKARYSLPSDLWRVQEFLQEQESATTNMQPDTMKRYPVPQDAWRIEEFMTGEMPRSNPNRPSFLGLAKNYASVAAKTPQ